MEPRPLATVVAVGPLIEGDLLRLDTFLHCPTNSSTVIIP
jgi:hypothetical protein